MNNFMIKNILILVLGIYAAIMTILFIYKTIKYNRMGNIALKLDTQLRKLNK